MTEWGVISVIVTMVGLGVSICAPIIKLNTSITKLTTLLDRVNIDLIKLETDNHASHKRLWAKTSEQDGALHNHETRITLLEKQQED